MKVFNYTRRTSRNEASEGKMPDLIRAFLNIKTFTILNVTSILLHLNMGKQYEQLTFQLLHDPY